MPETHTAPWRNIALAVAAVALAVFVWFLLSAGGKTAQVGDANGDGKLDRADVERLSEHVLSGGPRPIGSGDVNGDGKVNVADILYLINHVNGGGPPPVGWATPTPAGAATRQEKKP